MSTTHIDYAEIKSIMKDALIEILQERRELFQEIFREILADPSSRTLKNGVSLDTGDKYTSSSIDELVKQIKATPPDPTTITQGSKVGDMEYVQYLLDNPPTDTISAEEWERLWPEHESEMKALDVAQAIAEGRP